MAVGSALTLPCQSLGVWGLGEDQSSPPTSDTLWQVCVEVTGRWANLDHPDTLLEMTSLSLSISNQDPCIENTAPLESWGYVSPLGTGRVGFHSRALVNSGSMGQHPGTRARRPPQDPSVPPRGVGDSRAQGQQGTR